MALVWMALGGRGSGNSPAADFPKAEITNGQIRVSFICPMARTDTTAVRALIGQVSSAPLSTRATTITALGLIGLIPRCTTSFTTGLGIVASPCSGISGPVEEYSTNHSALGWDEAKVGEPSSKSAVGVLRKDRRSMIT